MCVDLCRGHRKRNKVVPYEDLISERLEVRPNRFIRVLHWSPRFSVSPPEGSFTNSRSSHDGRSESRDSQDSRNIIVIFFIHGVGGCADLWQEQLRHFCRAGYEVVAPDLLGHGGSSAPRNQADYEFSELAKDVLAVFDRYARKRNILVGHSYGSSFCSLISAKRSRLVSKVVLLAGGGPVPLRPDSCHLFCLPLPMLGIFKPLLFCTFERRAFYNKSAVKGSAKNLKAFSAPLFVLKAVVEGQNWLEGDVSFHKDLMVPVLLLYGACDKFVSLEEEQWMLEAVYGSSLEVIQNAGHMVMLESPEKVNWFIHNFLQRDPTTRSTIQLSHSRELSQASIHIRCTPKSHSGSRSYSLALRSLKEFSVESPETSRSTSDLPRNSVVSLEVPAGGHGKSYSFPGSVSDMTADEQECQAKVKLKENGMIEFLIGDSSDNARAAEEKAVKEEQEPIRKSPNCCSDTSSPSRSRRSGVVRVSSNSPLPSLETVDTHL